MTKTQNDEPEEGATPEAVALHGSQARAEQHEQPDAMPLDGDTLIARPATDDTDTENV